MLGLPLLHLLILFRMDAFCLEEFLNRVVELDGFFVMLQYVCYAAFQFGFPCEADVFIL